MLKSLRACLLVVMLSLVIVAEAWPQTDSDRSSRGKQIYSDKQCAAANVPGRCDIYCYLMMARRQAPSPSLP